MCLALPPPIGGLKTILGSNPAPCGGFDCAPDGFSELSAVNQSSGGPSLSTPRQRRGTLITPPPLDFKELNTKPAAIAQKGLSVTAFDAS